MANIQKKYYKKSIHLYIIFSNLFMLILMNFNFLMHFHFDISNLERWPVKILNYLEIYPNISTITNQKSVFKIRYRYINATYIGDSTFADWDLCIYESFAGWSFGNTSCFKVHSIFTHGYSGHVSNYKRWRVNRM